jgi:hypothetical protein
VGGGSRRYQAKRFIAFAGMTPVTSEEDSTRSNILRWRTRPRGQSGQNHQRIRLTAPTRISSSQRQSDEIHVTLNSLHHPKKHGA